MIKKRKYIIALALLGVLIMLAVALLNTDRISKKTEAKFGRDITIGANEQLVLNDEGKEVLFRITELEPPENPDAECLELCLDTLPTLTTQLDYDDNSYKGTVSSGIGSVDMTFESNGAYELIPYHIEIIDTDQSTYATVNVTKKELVQAELGEPFRIGNNGVAVLSPGETGVHIRFGTCGAETPCIRILDAWVDGERMLGPNPFRHSDAENQFRAKPGGYFENGTLRLRLIESDDITSAVFVFEKI